MAWRAREFGFVYCREREPRKRAAESHQVNRTSPLDLESGVVMNEVLPGPVDLPSRGQAGGGHGGADPDLPKCLSVGPGPFFMKWPFFMKNHACPNLDAKSVPEALVYSILHHFAQGIRIKHP